MTEWSRQPPTTAGLWWHCDERGQVGLLHLAYPADCSGDVVTYSSELAAKRSKAFPHLAVIPPHLKHGFFAIPTDGWWMPCFEPEPPVRDGQLDLFGGNT